MREERLLERLCAIEKDPGRREARDNSRLIRSIMDHLQRILNTREGSVQTAPDFGVPDFTNMAASEGAGSMKEIERSLKRVIQKYEPRLVQPRIEFSAYGDDVISLRFKVMAKLAGDKTSISFTTSVRGGGEVRVSE